jgi:hypothetical protein
MASRDLLPMWKAIKHIRIQPEAKKTDCFYAIDEVATTYSIFTSKAGLLSWLSTLDEDRETTMAIGSLSRIPAAESPTMLDLYDLEPFVLQDIAEGRFYDMDEASYFKYGADFKGFLRTHRFWKRHSLGSYPLPGGKPEMIRVIQNVTIVE